MHPRLGRGGLKGCGMLRITHCLDKRLKDGGEFVRFAHRLRSTPPQTFLFLSGTHFC
jgi:hypothetical protein